MAYPVPGVQRWHTLPFDLSIADVEGGTHPNARWCRVSLVGELGCRLFKRYGRRDPWFEVPPK
jgi:hypothetical protein